MYTPKFTNLRQRLHRLWLWVFNITFYNTVGSFIFVVVNFRGLAETEIVDSQFSWIGRNWDRWHLNLWCWYQQMTYLVIYVFRCVLNSVLQLNQWKTKHSYSTNKYEFTVFQLYRNGQLCGRNMSACRKPQNCQKSLTNLMIKNCMEYILSCAQESNSKLPYNRDQDHFRWL